MNVGRRFFARPLPRCNCGKPATYEVLVSGNNVYDRSCDRHVDARIRQFARDSGAEYVLPSKPSVVRVRGVAGGPR